MTLPAFFSPFRLAGIAPDLPVHEIRAQLAAHRCLPIQARLSQPVAAWLNTAFAWAPPSLSPSIH